MVRLQDPSKWDIKEWCPRHWAPSPLLGYQGMRAQRMLMEHYMSELKPPNINSPKAINRHLASLETPICCQLGDDRMYALWGQCAPPRNTQ